MTSNYYTLRALVRELAPMLVGARFLEAYAQRPNELRLRFDRGTLVAVLRPIDGALFFLSREEHRPRNNIHLFFTELAGKEVREISISENDRLITIEIGDSRLELSFFGTPNATLRSPAGTETFKKAGIEPSDNPSTGSATATLGKRYKREAEHQGWSEEEMARRLVAANGAIMHRNGDELLLALLPLEHLGAKWEQQIIPSINEAVRQVVIDRAKLARIKGVRMELLKNVDAQIERLHRMRSDMRRGVENSNRSERYAAIANAILMSAHEIQRGAKSVVLSIEESAVEVTLDPEMNPYENAARYFDRSKRAKESIDELRTRTVSVAAELEKLQTIRGEIESALDLDALLEMKRRLGKETAALDKGGDLAPTYRTFQVPGGITVLVGKNAKQNDELTLHVAKKEDIWLHARGVPGSHVILQSGKRPQVPREAIEQAAEIAAFYSEAKSQGVVPVSYTQKKYVRKPKGAAPGAVVMEREEVIMVRPHIRAKQL